MRFNFTSARIPARGFTLDCSVQDSRIEIRAFNDVRIDFAALTTDGVKVREHGRSYGRDTRVIRFSGHMTGGTITINLV